ncbi:MAG: arsenate reductase [Pseudomonadota bacterium]
MTTLYGIPNCDSVKKARNWLESHEIDYTFHDIRSDGLTQSQVSTWLALIGRDTLVNKRSTSWRQLSDELKTALSDQSTVELILQHPTLMKRPLLELSSNEIEVGFNSTVYQSRLIK